jgi:hypothetical protein
MPNIPKAELPGGAAAGGQRHNTSAHLTPGLGLVELSESYLRGVDRPEG